MPVGERSGTGRDPKLLGDQLDRFVAERGWVGDVAVGAVIGRWSADRRARDRAALHAGRLRRGVLTVRADSTAWATQLRLLSSSLLARLAEEVGEGTVGESAGRRPGRAVVVARVSVGRRTAGARGTPTAEAASRNGVDPAGRPRQDAGMSPTSDAVDGYLASAPETGRTFLLLSASWCSVTRPRPPRRCRTTCPPSSSTAHRLMHASAWKEHLAIYPLPAGGGPRRRRRRSLEAHSSGASTLKLPYREEFPTLLVDAVVRAHLARVAAGR